MRAQYISDIIGNEYKNWNSFNPNMRHILISGGTGTGKTHFVMNSLLDYCTANNKCILYICNRAALLTQLENQVKRLPSEKQERITLTLYQRYAKTIKNGSYISYRYGAEIYLLFRNYESSRVSDPNNTGNYFEGYISFCLFKEIFKENNSFNVNWNDLTVRLIKVLEYTGQNVPEDTAYAYCRFSYKPNSVFARHIKQLKLFDIQYYDFVVFDEIHYLLQDSTFNFGTYDMLRIIEKPLGEKTTAIYMTATPHGIKDIILSIIASRYQAIDPGIFMREYAIEPDYSSIDPHVISCDGELIEKILASGDDRWLIFVDSKKHGSVLEEKITRAFADREETAIKPCRFIYRKAYVDAELRKIQRTGAFSDTKCIISTSILDNGISIEHPDFHHIVIETWDSTEFIQMLGRKRLKDDERLQLYVFDRSQGDIEKHRKNTDRKLKIINEAISAARDVSAIFRFTSKYCRNIRSYSELNGLVRFIPSGLEINYLAKMKLEMQKNEYELLYSFPSFGSLAKYQLSLINKEHKAFQNTRRERIINILERECGAEHSFTEIRKIISDIVEPLKKINHETTAAFRRVKGSTSVNRMNEWLTTAKTGYIIETKTADKHTKCKSYTIVKVQQQNDSIVSNKVFSP